LVELSQYPVQDMIPKTVAALDAGTVPDVAHADVYDFPVTGSPAMNIVDGTLRRNGAGEVIVVEPTGAETELLVQAGKAQMVVVMHGRTAVKPGDRVGLAIEVNEVHLFDAQTREVCRS